MREKDVNAKSSAYFVRQYERSQLKTNIKKENLHLASSLPYTFKCNEPSILSYLFVLFFRAAALPEGESEVREKGVSAKSSAYFVR